MRLRGVLLDLLTKALEMHLLLARDVLHALHALHRAKFAIVFHLFGGGFPRAFDLGEVQALLLHRLLDLRHARRRLLSRHALDAFALLPRRRLARRSLTRGVLRGFDRGDVRVARDALLDPLLALAFLELLGSREVLLNHLTLPLLRRLHPLGAKTHEIALVHLELSVARLELRAERLDLLLFLRLDGRRLLGPLLGASDAFGALRLLDASLAKRSLARLLARLGLLLEALERLLSLHRLVRLRRAHLLLTLGEELRLARLLRQLRRLLGGAVSSVHRRRLPREIALHALRLRLVLHAVRLHRLALFLQLRLLFLVPSDHPLVAEHAHRLADAALALDLGRAPNDVLRGGAETDGEFGALGQERVELLRTCLEVVRVRGGDELGGETGASEGVEVALEKIDGVDAGLHAHVHRPRGVEHWRGGDPGLTLGGLVPGASKRLEADARAGVGRLGACDREREEGGRRSVVLPHLATLGRDASRARGN